MKIDKDKRKKLIIAWLPVVVMFLVGDWVSCICRVYFHDNEMAGFMMIVQKPYILIHAMPLSIHPIDILVGAVIGFIIWLLLQQMKANRKKYKKGEEQGSAHWGTAEDIKPYKDPEFSNNVILSKTEFLTMNSCPKDWKTARNKNVLVIGGSGSGKTRYVVKPNLMQMHSSYVVTDPKGTILNELGHMFRQNGYKIKVLNLIDFDKSMHYNPFEYIKDEKDILKFVEVFVANTKGDGGGGNDGDFWEKAEKLLYQALIGAICTEFPKFERNMNTVVELVNQMEVREDDETFKNCVDLYFEGLEQEKPNHFAVKQYKKYKLAAGKTAKSILISCAARLAPFDIPQVADLVRSDELELDKIGDRKTALFVIIPDTDAAFNFLVSIMYTQMFNLLCTHADNDCGGKLPIPVRCMLDEFANIGKIPNFEKLIATIRSREISATIILQAKSQLKAIYKDNMDTIVGNCDTTIFLGGKERGTIKDLTEELGKETIDDYNMSDTRGSSLSKGINYSKLSHDLMSMDKLETMDRGKCVVQVAGISPFLSDKYELTEHPNYKYHASDKKDKDGNIIDKKWFDVEKYVKAQRKGCVEIEDIVKDIDPNKYVTVNSCVS